MDNPLIFRPFLIELQSSSYVKHCSSWPVPAFCLNLCANLFAFLDCVGRFAGPGRDLRPCTVPHPYLLSLAFSHCACAQARGIASFPVDFFWPCQSQKSHVKLEVSRCKPLEYTAALRLVPSRCRIVRRKYVGFKHREPPRTAGYRLNAILPIIGYCHCLRVDTLGPRQPLYFRCRGLYGRTPTEPKLVSIRNKYVESLILGAVSHRDSVGIATTRA